VRFILFTPDHVEEVAKNIMRVMWTRRRLRMKLNAEHWFLLHPNTFQRVVVQTFVRDLHFVFVQVTRGDAVVMVLGGDENLTRWQMLNGMIPAVMSELEAVGIRT
jgi:hypothetical protein